jgi:hypothetical protein
MLIEEEAMIEAEAQNTREAWGKFFSDNDLAYDSIEFKDGTPIYGWNIHHSTQVEPLSYPIEDRIQFILTHKDEAEQVIRFKNMRPVSLESLKTITLARKLYAESVASADKLYTESIAPAQKLYDESIASAWKLYKESTASARKIYEKSVASAWKLLDESVASAWKLLNESTAFTPARELYDESFTSARKLLNESIASAHLADVPNHTWNGENIF